MVICNDWVVGGLAKSFKICWLDVQSGHSKC